VFEEGIITMSDKKICPVYAGLVAITMRHSSLTDMQRASLCIENQCAWWNEERKVCGVKQ